MPIRCPVKINALADEELLDLYYAGDDEAFNEFDRRHRLSLTRRAYRRLSPYQGARWEMANDLASDTLLSVVRTKSRLKKRWNSERGPVAPWLQRVLQNRVISFQRSRKNKQVLDSDLHLILADGRASVVNLLTASEAQPENSDLEKAELLQRLQPAIEQLPPQQQHIIHLKYWDDLTHREIGAQVGLSAATVSRRLSEARNFLCSALAKFLLSA